MALPTRPRALAAALAGAALAAAVAQAALPQQSGTVDLLTQSNVRIDGAAPGDVFGELASSAGDVNGDGLGDVIVATTGKGPTVVFGRTDQANVDLAALGGAGFKITGSDFSSGSPVAGVGDVNGDGLSDVLVGTPAVDRAWVVFGKKDGGSVDLANLGTGGYLLQGVAAEAAGRSVSGVPDMNGDGRRELVIGADSAGRNGRAGSGSVYVVFGKADPSTVTLNSLGAGGFRIDGAQANHFAGGPVAAGPDVNGDQVPDIAVSAPGADYSFASAGAVYVVFGKSSTTNVDLVNVDAGNGGFRIDGQRGSDQIARSLDISPDMTGDGLGEVAVGTDFADNPTAGDGSAGSVWVVFGKASGSAVPLAALGSGGFRIDGQKAGDQFGRSLASVGDFNDDGLPDLAAGALFADNSRANGGSAYVVFGRSATTTIATSTLGSSGVRIDGAASSDSLGRSVASAGDFNGDGRADVLGGAEFADPAGRNSAGSAYVVYGFGTPSLSYSPGSIAATLGAPITPVGPSAVRRTGTAGFTITPALPAGLGIDAFTGTISGTPSTVAADAPYTVTMTDLAGTATATVNVRVDVPPSPIPNPNPLTPPALLSGRCVNAKNGTAAADKLTGSAFGDRIKGGAGNDVISGLAGDDCLYGQGGKDRIDGGKGNDTVDGGAGADTLKGGAGKDRFKAGSGNDFVNAKDRVKETVDCGKGRDRVRADRRDKLVGCEKRVR